MAFQKNQTSYKTLYKLPTTPVNPNLEFEDKPNSSETKAFLGSRPEAVKVFSGLIDCGHAAARTWFHLRGLDIPNQGWVDIDLSDVAKRQGSSNSTIYRHLSNKIFFPQVYKVPGGKIRVYINGLANVCIAVGIDSVKRLGASTEFLVEWLGDRMKCAIYATELEAQNGQRQAYRQASKSKREEDANEIIDPAVAVSVLSKGEERLNDSFKKIVKKSERSESFIGFKVRRFRYFKISPNQNVPGITQVEVAERLNRSRITTQRRLSNRTRLKYGINPLYRRRVVQELYPNVESSLNSYLLSIGSNFASVSIDNKVIQVGRLKQPDGSYKVYRLLTNIYEFDFPLLTTKRIRARFKQKLEKVKKLSESVDTNLVSAGSG